MAAEAQIAAARRVAPRDDGTDLVAWSAGYLAGWDAALSSEVRARVADLAETIALHDATPWIAEGAMCRDRRIAREITEGERHARTVRQSADWPTVAIPGAGVDGHG